MARITLKGTPCETVGELPGLGLPAPAFRLSKTDLSDTELSDFAGRTVVLNIFPSIDTPVCAASVRRFNKESSEVQNTVVLCISGDLPFAHERFCEVEGLKDVDFALAPLTPRDMDALLVWARAARGLGFEGMGCIHPRQIGPIHEGFSPTQQELEKALRIVAAFEDANAKGLGVVSLGTKMIDPPVVLRAQRIVNQAKATGLLPDDAGDET